MSSSFRPRPPQRTVRLPAGGDAATARVLAECLALERQLERDRRERDELLAEVARAAETRRDLTAELARTHERLSAAALVQAERDRLLAERARLPMRIAGWWLRLFHREPPLEGIPTRQQVMSERFDTPGPSGDAGTRVDTATLPVDGSIHVQVDEPVADGVVTAGDLTVAGWAIGAKRVARIDVFVNETLVASCRPEVSRPDVARAFPQYEHGEPAGYSTVVHLAQVPPGPHTLRVRATDTSGAAEVCSRALWVEPRDPVALRPPCRRFTLYTSSLGNYFFDEIRDLLAAGLRELGFGVDVSDDRYGFSSDADWHIVIAPHEFFRLGEGPSLLAHDLPSRLVLVNTEQPSTQWFAAAFEYFDRAQMVWDINFDSSERLRARGVSCCYVPLGFSASFDAAFGASDLPIHYGTCFLEPSVRGARTAKVSFDERPIDILFVGHLSERRERFLATAAPVLARYQSYLHLSSAAVPIVPGRTTHMDTATVAGLAQRSKIVLNVHHGHDRYFEWHRMVMHGIWHRALVLTEPCGDAPPFRAGHDFVQVPLDGIPGELDRLLATSEGRADAMRTIERATLTLTERCRLTETLRSAVLLLFGAPELPAAFTGDIALRATASNPLSEVGSGGADAPSTASGATVDSAGQPTRFELA